MVIDSDALHRRLLRLLKQLNSVCEENGIAYYMIGGTCLGALRHKGFIPWDDDVDVGMLRKDYEKFISLAKERLGEGFEIKYYANTDDSPFHYIKFIDSNTTLIEQEYQDYLEGLYIDVFPIDSMPTDALKRKVLYFRAHILQSLIINHCSTKTDGNVAKRLYRYFAKHINLDFLHKRLEEVITSCNVKSAEFKGNILGAWGLREIVKSSLFGTPVLYEFEDSSFYGPEQADAYLQAIYGDWETLPPIEERISRHNYHYINLNLPYKEYMLSSFDK